jgi:hypothetical protein
MLGKYKELTNFDLVYAAGLYDYLPDKIATDMTTWMVGATKPGGITLLTNFITGTPTDGYMEAFMNWPLIYRNIDQLGNTANAVRGQVSATKSYFDDDNVIAFIELHKQI